MTHELPPITKTNVLDEMMMSKQLKKSEAAKQGLVALTLLCREFAEETGGKAVGAPWPPWKPSPIVQRQDHSVSNYTQYELWRPPS